jgi:hypothetical protein
LALWQNEQLGPAPFSKVKNAALLRIVKIIKQSFGAGKAPSLMDGDKNQW